MVARSIPLAMKPVGNENRHHELMSPDQVLEVVADEEVLGDVGPVGLTNAASRDVPAIRIRWVRPKKIANNPLVE